MDPYSAEGELINIHNHFHQGQFQEVVDFDTSSLSAENALSARVLKLRAQVALGQADDVLAAVKGAAEPELVAVGALAELAAGRTEDAVRTAETLAAEAADNATVQVLAGTVLQAAGKSEEALALLSQHQGNRELQPVPVPVPVPVWEAQTAVCSADGVFVCALRSRRRRIDRPDLPAAEPQRPGCEGGRCCEEVGAGQSPGQLCRVVGRPQTGEGFLLLQRPKQTGAVELLIYVGRAARNTSRRSTSSRSWRRARRRRRCGPSCRRRWRSCTWDAPRRRRRRWTRR